MRNNNDDSVLELVRARLESSGLTHRQRLLVLAAFESQARLELAEEDAGSEHGGGATDGQGGDQGSGQGGDQGPGQGAGQVGGQEGEPAKAFLKSATVTGFRGIGAEAVLPLRPGPGLTIVVGRNGSGKSSFAEGIEAALTGTTYRFDKGPATWREGLRNVHEQVPTEVAVEMVVDGEQGPTTVHRSWSGRNVKDSECVVERAGNPRMPHPELGWDPALTTYRPFLSYPELGKAIGGQPSAMYDVLVSILGLGRITEAEGRLRGQRKLLEDEAREVKAEYERLVEELATINDDRAGDARAALAQVPHDLEKAARIAAGVTASPSPEIASVRRMANLELPSEERVYSAVAELRQAAEAVAALRGTAADESRRLANLLQQALDHHDRHADEASCPVCGTEGVLDAAWAEGARSKAADLRHSAEQVDAASRRVRQAMDEARTLLVDIPEWLPADSPVRSAWAAWTAARTHPSMAADPVALADHLEQAFPLLRDECARARERAKLELERLDENWQPVAGRLASWVRRAKTAGSQKRKDVKKALEWLRRTGFEVRDERFLPLGKETGEIWRELRQESNVDLGPIRLDGSPTRRRLALDATVDGLEASLGVLSQGELYSLALALFLPRMTMTESPFGFAVIDDPVQSMDPAKVDGLARVLADAAKTRQVVVFTHDTRLTNAVRRLDFDAEVWEVVRQAGSRVDLRANDSPAKRALSDARAMVDPRSKVPEFVARRTVPGLCRSSVEAALTDLAWRQRMAQYTKHVDLQDELIEAQARAQSTAALASLAYHRKTNRSPGQMRDLFRLKYDERAAEVFDACCQAPHQSYSGELPTLIEDTRQLVERIDAER